MQQGLEMGHCETSVKVKLVCHFLHPRHKYVLYSPNLYHPLLFLLCYVRKTSVIQLIQRVPINISVDLQLA